jgi:hypothetical protein
MEFNFEALQVYDFSNIDLQEEGSDNCFTNPCDWDGCDSGCNSW